MTLIEQLKRHEGFMAKPYLCSEGILTFGYGLTYITEEEAEVVLAMRADAIKTALTFRIAGLSSRRKNVIINMAYNLGVKGVLGFKRMWAAIDDGDYDAAAAEILNSKYARQVGYRAVELAEIMRRG